MNLGDFIFRAEEVLTNNVEIDPVVAGGFAALLAGMMIVIGSIVLVFYVLTSIIYMKIGKKAGYPSPGLAWIPGIGPALISAKIAQMHWWPVLLLIGLIIPFIGQVFALVFAIFMIVWTWKVFEAFGKPGWWALFNLLQPVGFVLIAIVAFGSSQYSGSNLGGSQKTSEQPAQAKTAKK